MSKKTAIDFISQGEPWAITPEAMDTIIQISQRLNESPEAVAARLGKPLDNTRSVTIQDGVAIVTLSGPIFPKANMMTELSGATSLEAFIQDLVAADENPAVQATVIDMHSPGGQTIGIHEGAGIIKKLKKPCVAYVGGMGASAAYLLASAADHIVIDPMGLAGSIGVVMKPAKKEDGSVEIVSSVSPDKRPDHSTEPGRAVYQTLVDDMAAVFVQAVAENRGKTPDHIISAKGRMLVGQKAVDHGLADATGTLESSITYARQLAGNPNPAHRYTHMSEKTPMTAATLLAEHPAVHAEIVALGEKTGYDKGFAEGKAAELARIQAVEAVALPGHEALIASLKFDGKTTGPEAAMQLIAAEKTAGNAYLETWRANAPPPVPQVPLTAEQLAAKAEADKQAEAKMPEPQDVYAARAKAQAQ